VVFDLDEDTETGTGRAARPAAICPRSSSRWLANRCWTASYSAGIAVPVSRG